MLELFIMYTFIISISFLVALGASLHLAKKYKYLELIDRLCVIYLPIVITIIIFLLLSFLLSPTDWEEIRLAPSTAFLYKIPVFNYQSAPLLNTIYGPTSILAYLPVSFIPNPLLSLIIAKLLSMFYFFAPCIFLFIQETKKKRLGKNAFFLVFVWFFYFASFTPINGMAFSVHVNSVALGCGMLACTLVYFEEHKKSCFILALTAWLTVIAVYAKVSLLPILLVIPLFILIADERDIFFRYCFHLCTGGLAITAFYGAVFGFKNILFNMHLVFWHPWNQYLWLADKKFTLIIGPNLTFEQRVAVLFEGFRDMLKAFLFILTSLIFALTYPFVLEKKRFDFFENIRTNRWLLFVFAGIAMIPTALIGRVIVGGEPASFGFSLYFIIAGMGIIFLRACSDQNPFHNFISQKTIKLFFLILVALFSLRNVWVFANMGSRIENFSPAHTRVIQAYSFIKKHPGEVYFPWNPLAHISAEHKAYHFLYGLMDREMALHKVSQEQFNSFIPKNLTMVVYPPDIEEAYVEYMKTYLPEYTEIIEVPELYKWWVFVKPETAEKYKNGSSL